MRKPMAFAASFVLCLLLAACGGQSAQPTPASTEDPELSRPENWREMAPAFEPDMPNVPETWECRQPVYELREDGTEYGEFIWFDENGNTRREASYLGAFCTERTDYDELGRFLYCFEADPDSALLRESRYRYADTDGETVITRRYVDEQNRFEGFVTENHTTGVTESEKSEFGEDNTLLRQTFSRIADGTAWICVRSFEDGRIVTRYERDGVVQRTWTQRRVKSEAGRGYDFAEMHDADGNLLFTYGTDSDEGGTTKTVTVPDCTLTVRTENNTEIYVNDVLVSAYRDGGFIDGPEAALRRFTDRATGDRRWIILKDGETWMEIFWKAEPLGNGSLLDAYDISVRYGEPERVSVEAGVEWTEAWQKEIPLTDGNLIFKDYAAVYAQLSEAERKNPWAVIPYEVEGLGLADANGLYDDPEAALNVRPEGWRVPEGGSWTANVMPLVGLVRCTLRMEQQTDVLPGEIIEPWTLLNYDWNEWDEESGSGSGRSIRIAVKPGAFDYDPDPNRGAGIHYDMGRFDLNDPGTAAHTFVGDMDSRIGRAKLAIRTEESRCHISMVLDETGYWVDTVGLTQAEVTELLLSIVNSAPESGVRGGMQEDFRKLAESGECWPEAESESAENAP